MIPKPTSIALPRSTSFDLPQSLNEDMIRSDLLIRDEYKREYDYFYFHNDHHSHCRS